MVVTLDQKNLPINQDVMDKRNPKRATVQGCGVRHQWSYFQFGHILQSLTRYFLFCVVVFIQNQYDHYNLKADFRQVCAVLPTVVINIPVYGKWIQAIATYACFSTAPHIFSETSEKKNFSDSSKIDVNF